MRETEKMIAWEDRFREYLKKYCKSRNVLPEEAIKHNLVHEVRKQYEKLGDIDDLSAANSGWTDYGCCK